MRLYNAASCTPCCSTWEAPARRLPKSVPTYVPKTSSSSASDTEIQDPQGVENENKEEHAGTQKLKLEPFRQNREKYQYLSKIPSTTTSTTGGETPPFDNTSGSPPPEDGHGGQESNRNKISGTRLNGNLPTGAFPLQQARNAPTIATASGPRWKLRREQHVLPLKKHEIGDFAIRRCEDEEYDDPDVCLDLTTTDMHSSCSTLTTTRSMKLQQESQEDCAITVSSLDETDDHDYKPIVESPFRPKSTQIGILKIEPKPQEIPIQRTNNLPPTGIADMSSDSDCTASDRDDPSPPLSFVSGDTSPSKIRRDGIWQIKRGQGEVMLSKAPHSKPMQAANNYLPLSQVESNIDYAAVKQRLRKVAVDTQEQERIDFFPLKTAAMETTVTSDVAPRLGASSRFPRVRRQQEQPDDESWDPFDDQSDKEMTNLGSESAWVDFAGKEDPKDWTDSEWQDCESPVAFPSRELDQIGDSDDPITGLLEDHYHSGRSTHRKNIDEHHLFDKDDDFSGDTRKGARHHGESRMAGVGGKQRICLPRPDFFQKPKLLGPLLEKRFTQKYWRRLKGSQKKAVGTEEQHKNEWAVESAIEKDNKDSIVVVRGQLSEASQKSAEDWTDWTDSGHDKVDAQDKMADATVKEEPSPAVAAAKLLSPQRVKDCQAALDSIGLPPDQLVTMIDRVDASVPLTKNQISALFDFLPTPKEKYLILQYLRSCRKPVSLLEVFDNRSELLMVQLVGVEEAQLKLEALSFQYEFPNIVGKLRKDCQLLQKCCDEILQSSRLEKVLGITNMLGNGLVGKAPGKKKTNKISLQSLADMMAESQPMKGANQPFLAYACSRIQRTKPSLLNFSDELPSLPMAVRGQADWDIVRLELEALEARFEAFREFALSYSWNESNTMTDTPDTMSVEEEIDILQSTSVGAFAVNTCLRMAEFYQDYDETQNRYDALLRHFVGDEDARDKPSLSTILATFERFASYVEEFQ